jgi:hypothetical protein
MSEPAERPVLFDREALIASLDGDERINALHAALADAERAAVESITKVMLHSTKEIDQRKIDYTRGYYAGARYWTGARMTDAQTRIALSAAEIEEDDA